MFGERVKELRLAKGLSQAALAEKIGMTQAHLSALENGKTNPAGIGAEVYLKLCDALGVDCQDLRGLLSVPDEPPPEQTKGVRPPKK